MSLQWKEGWDLLIDENDVERSEEGVESLVGSIELTLNALMMESKLSKLERINLEVEFRHADLYHHFKINPNSHDAVAFWSELNELAFSLPQKLEDALREAVPGFDIEHYASVEFWPRYVIETVRIGEGFHVPQARLAEDVQLCSLTTVLKKTKQTA